MRKYRFLSALIAVILLLVSAAPCSYALEAPSVSSARSFIIGDAESGRVLLDANAYTRSEPASLTKIMTVLLAVEAIERGDAALDDMVTASESSHFDLTDDGSTAHINSGERISLKDLLYCAMLVSANEACNIIAEHISGSAEKFVGLMNARAQELGCSGTHFANTHGLPSKEHYTTARDLFLIAREALSHQLFAEICGTAEYTVGSTNYHGARELENSNALINEDSVYGKKYLYEGAEGIKTGHTEAAGYCLASAAERNGLELICIVLGASGGKNDSGEKCYDSFEDTAALLDWGFENFSYRSIVEEGYIAGTVEYRGEKLQLACTEPLRALAPNDFGAETLKKDIRIDEAKLTGEIKAGDELGTVSFTDEDGNDYGTVRLAAADSAQSPEAEEGRNGLTREQIILVVICVLILLAAGVIVTVSLVRGAGRNKRKKHAQQRKRDVKPAVGKQPKKQRKKAKKSGGRKAAAGRKGGK